jgi:hypothetical protein
MMFSSHFCVRIAGMSATDCSVGEGGVSPANSTEYHFFHFTSRSIDDKIWQVNLLHKAKYIEYVKKS